MNDERSFEIMGNDGKFYKLNYTHKEIQDLLSKLATGRLLNVTDYDKLMEIQVDNISTFTGHYDDLIDKPDIDLLERTVDELCNCTGGSLLQRRINTIQENISTIEANIVEEIRKITEQQFELVGDFVTVGQILELKDSVNSLADSIGLLRNEISRVESISYNKASLTHTHNASEFKLGDKTLDAAIALKAGIDHTHDEYDYRIDEVDDSVVALNTNHELFKNQVEEYYQKKIDLDLLTESKTIVGAINELYKILMGQ